MTNERLLLRCSIVSALVSVPFVFLHLVARPDDAPISLLQRFTAALANLFGPWGVSIVRLVDFPNAGLRSFSWVLAFGLTAVGALLVAIAPRVRSHWFGYIFLGGWTVFFAVWLLVGFTQIADGLL